MPGPGIEKCGDCYFCSSPEALTITTAKVCRRYPPEVVSVVVRPGQLNVSGHFPPVPLEEWCGEFKSKPQLEKDNGESDKD